MKKHKQPPHVIRLIKLIDFLLITYSSCHTKHDVQSLIDIKNDLLQLNSLLHCYSNKKTQILDITAKALALSNKNNTKSIHLVRAEIFESFVYRFIRDLPDIKV